MTQPAMVAPRPIGRDTAGYPGLGIPQQHSAIQRCAFPYATRRQLATKKSPPHLAGAVLSQALLQISLSFAALAGRPVVCRAAASRPYRMYHPVWPQLDSESAQESSDNEHELG